MNQTSDQYRSASATREREKVNQLDFWMTRRQVAVDEIAHTNHSLKLKKVSKVKRFGTFTCLNLKEVKLWKESDCPSQSHCEFFLAVYCSPLGKKSALFSDSINFSLIQKNRVDYDLVFLPWDISSFYLIHSTKTFFFLFFRKKRVLATCWT